MQTNIAAFQNDRGLVPMVITVPGGMTPYAENGIYGFPVDVAERYFIRGIARLYRPGEDDQNGGVIVQALPTQEVLPPVNLVEIPDNWPELHVLQQIKLAKAIAATDRRIDKDEAKEIIERELERRANL